MKVLALMGTYRRGGNTETLVDAVLHGARQAGANTEKIHLMDLDIRYCRNCLQCWKRPELKLGKCPIEDDVASVLRKITRSDGLILATPINYKWPTALIKTFMERMGPLLREKGRGPGFMARVPVQRLTPDDNPRKGVGIVSCHGSNIVAFSGNKMLGDMFKLVNVKDAESITCAWQYGGIYPLEKRPLMFKKAERLGRKLAS